MEDAYRQSLFKSFKKTVDDGFFPFIIVDATNEKVTHFEEFWSYAKSKGFQVCMIFNEKNGYLIFSILCSEVKFMLMHCVE